MFYLIGQKDRSGSQIQSYITVLSCVNKYNLEIKGICLRKYISETSDLINLLGLPPSITDTNGLQFISYPGAPNAPKNSAAITIENYEFRQSKFTPEFLNQIRNNFHYEERTTDDVLRIGVHIRRGDVSSTNKHSVRFLSNEYYLTILKKIKEMTNRKMRIDIFSQPESCESFDIFTNTFSDCFIHLNNDQTHCWKTLINSDIFIMSKGSFSFVPALYHKNIVIYSTGIRTQDRLCLDEWIQYNSSTIDKELKEKLQTYQRL